VALIEKSMLVEYPADRMLELVNDIDSYPEFLPWCAGAEVVRETEDTLRATLKIGYKGIRQQFSTRNHSEAPHDGEPGSITMALVDGPFRTLHGKWRFKPLGDEACKIEFTLRYEFSNKLLEKVIGPAFNYIANSFVDAFVKRANSLHGKR
jgi:ribosome-associated toxin RatA of RatAB toxin-antitoxin module